MAVVDNAVYKDGVRVANPASLDETFDEMHAKGGMGWIGLLTPTPEELAIVADELGLHNLAVEDALKGQQRSKLEHYGTDMAVVARSARYDDASETVEFGDIHVFVGEQFAVTVRHAAVPDLAGVRKRLEASPELLAFGPFVVLYATLDEVVDGYAPVVAGLENDIDEIEDEIFGESRNTELSRRIYELHREVIEFQRAVRPLTSVLVSLSEAAEARGLDIELQRLLRDVHDHALRVDERVEGFRTLLDNALNVHAAIVARRLTEASFEQNEQVKRISAWAAILFAPSLVGTIYGMNFEHMPELSWQYGYPLALALMLALGTLLYGVFRRWKWL